MKQTYTDDSKHATNYGHSVQKKKYNNYIKDEIQRKVIHQGDWGKVETDPTEGYGTRLNRDLRYVLNSKYYYTEPSVKKYAKAYKKSMKK